MGVFVQFDFIKSSDDVGRWETVQRATSHRHQCGPQGMEDPINDRPEQGDKECLDHSTGTIRPERHRAVTPRGNIMLPLPSQPTLGA